ncbi:MAG: hypothetical protein ACXAD7_20195 [Candidatus Kariarchaeaceae archaeon]
MEVRYKLFPLERYLSDAKSNGWKVEIKPPPVLLSQIPTLDRELIEKLEASGIYDSEDLMEVDLEIANFLEMDADQFDEIKEIIHKNIKDQFEVPQIILNLPENYTLLAIATDNKDNALSLIWNNILFTWSNPKPEGWSLTKLAFDRFYVKAENPEVIGSIGLHPNLPSWLDQITDISTYVSTLLPGTSTTDRVLNLGYPPQKAVFSAREKSVNYTLELAYLLHIAKIGNSEFSK